MTRLIINRLLQLPLLLAVIFAVTFTLAWLVPGNPLGSEDRNVPAEIREAMLRQYNLHDPWRFAGQYLKDVFWRGDFGPSLSDRDRRVSQIIAAGLPVSATLGIAALVVALGLGVVTGCLGALRPGSWLESAGTAVAVIGISLPTFVTAMVLLVVFAGLLQWVRPAGLESPGQLVLPAIALGLTPAAYIARLVRLGLAETMTSDFIRTAQAKGLSHHQVLFRHALKVALLPVVSFLGPAAAATLTGSFVIEKVFEIPGLGRDFVNAVRNKDQFLILGLVLTYSTILIVFNLIVDVAYAWFDPRIELELEVS